MGNKSRCERFVLVFLLIQLSGLCPEMESLRAREEGSGVDYTFVISHFACSPNGLLFLFFGNLFAFCLQEYFLELLAFTRFSHHSLEAITGKVPCVL